MSTHTAGCDHSFNVSPWHCDTCGERIENVDHLAHDQLIEQLNAAYARITEMEAERAAATEAALGGGVYSHAFEFEARAAIDRVRKLHQPENGCDNPVHTVPDATCPQCCDYCQCCGEAMPCATIRAIDGEDSRFPTPNVIVMWTPPEEGQAAR